MVKAFDFSIVERHIARSRPDLDLDAETLAAYLGVSLRNVWNYRRHGMSHLIADRVCIRGLGIHPLHLYPEWGLEIAA